MDPVIIAAVIGALATIGAAVIGLMAGRSRGRKEGRRHSILKFMDEQERQLDRAIQAIRRGDEWQLRAIATAIVDNAHVWRRIQENFRVLLNGRIDDLSGTLGSSQATFRAIQSVVLALHEGFRARRLAVEAELEKSRI